MQGGDTMAMLNSLLPFFLMGGIFYFMLLAYRFTVAFCRGFVKTEKRAVSGSARCRKNRGHSEVSVLKFPVES